jgi:glycosyltransferase involved in cell wall biosynthesis
LSNRVIFTGSVPHDQIPAYLAAIDVAVAPYPALEDYYYSPLKLFEYMAMRRPVVASAIGQIAEVVDHQQNGWLYPPGDIDALRDALMLLATDPDLRDNLGVRARADVVAQHTWAQNAERLLAWIGRFERKRNVRARPSIFGREHVNTKPVG